MSSSNDQRVGPGSGIGTEKENFKWKKLEPKTTIKDGPQGDNKNKQQPEAKKSSMRRVETGFIPVKTPPIPVDILRGYAIEQQGTLSAHPSGYYRQNLGQKLLNNLLLPLSALVAAGCIFAMCRASYKRDTKKLQMFMRARITAQAVAISSAIIGVGAYSMVKQDDNDD